MFSLGSQTDDLAAILTAAVAFCDKKLAPGKIFSGGNLGGRKTSFKMPMKINMADRTPRRNRNFPT
jgi:hypothetical protein